MDVKYFYLDNHMDAEEYIMIKISVIHQFFFDKYNLKEKLYNGYIFA